MTVKDEEFENVWKTYNGILMHVAMIEYHHAVLWKTDESRK
jgi:hypothetical protein